MKTWGKGRRRIENQRKRHGIKGETSIETKERRNGYLAGFRAEDLGEEALIELVVLREENLQRPLWGLVAMRLVGVFVDLWWQTIFDEGMPCC